MLTYVKEAMFIEETGVKDWSTEKLSTGQQGTKGDFTIIHCNNWPEQGCQYTDPSHTWEKVLGTTLDGFESAKRKHTKSESTGWILWNKC